MGISRMDILKARTKLTRRVQKSQDNLIKTQHETIMKLYDELEKLKKEKEEKEIT